MKVHWQFDDMYSSMVTQDYDYNHNGKLEDNEVKALHDKLFMAFAPQSYFCFIKIDNKAFPVRYIKYFKAVLTDGILSYEFFIPCMISASNVNKRITIFTYDPSYYNAIFFSDHLPVTVTSSAPFIVKTSIREDTSIRYYFNQISPWTLNLEFRLK